MRDVSWGKRKQPELQLITARIRDPDCDSGCDDRKPFGEFQEGLI